MSAAHLFYGVKKKGFMFFCRDLVNLIVKMYKLTEAFKSFN